MSEQTQTPDIAIEELLSALVDGELTEAQVEQILESANSESLEQFNRYYIAHTAMHKEAYLSQTNAFASISAAIEREPEPGLSKVNQQMQPKDLFGESLSALVDGEASELELRRILNTDDAASLEKLGRYHLVSNVLNKDISLAQTIDVSSTVSAAIANENIAPDSVSDIEPKRSAWANLGRFGIAASVAGALVVGVQFLSVSEPQNIADNSVAPISGEPLLNNQNSVRVVGNESSIKAIDKAQDELDEHVEKRLK